MMSVETLTPNEFLCKAAHCLNSEVNRLAAKRSGRQGDKAKFLILAGHLFRIAYGLEQPNIHSESPSSRDTRRLLSALESICTPHEDVESPRIRTNHQQCAYPLLKRLISGKSRPKGLRESLKALIHSDADRKKLFRKLKRFLDTAVVITLPPPQQTPTCPKHVTSRLFRALKHKVVCRCNASPVPHFGCLELHTRPYGEHDNSFTFETVFRAAESHACNQWQTLRFSVARTEKKSPIQQSAIKAHESNHTTADPPSEIVSIDDAGLCELLRKPFGPIYWQLHVDHDDRLFRDSSPFQADRVLTEQPYLLTLTEALETRELSDDAKLLLAHTIAYSTWQFYDSEELSRRWTSDRIFFCRQRSASSQLNLDLEYDPLRPLVDIAFEKLQQLECQIRTCQIKECSAGRCDIDGEFLHGHYGVIPCAPRILALGILLKSILGKHPAHTRDQTHGVQSNWERVLNTEIFQCAKVLEEKEWPHLALRNESARIHLRNVVHACANRALFGTPERSVAERKTLLFEKIVWPLQCIARNAFLDRKAATWTIRETSRAHDYPNGEADTHITDESTPSNVATSNLITPRHSMGAAGVNAAHFRDSTTGSSTFSGINASGFTRVHAGHVFNNISVRGFAHESASTPAEHFKSSWCLEQSRPVTGDECDER